MPETETQVIFQTPIRDCEEQEKSVVSVSSGGSNTSLETGYEPDPDCPEGVIPQTQPCWKRGIHYTPLGLRRVYRKKRKLGFDTVAGDETDKQ